MSHHNPNQVPYDPRNPNIPPGYNPQNPYPHGVPHAPYPGYPYPAYPYPPPAAGHIPPQYPYAAYPPQAPVPHHLHAQQPIQPTPHIVATPQLETWVPNDSDSRQIDIWFTTLDTEFRNSIGGAEAVAFLKRSNLAKDTLREVWSIIDDKKTGRLDRLQFIAAIRMISILCNPSYAGSKPTVELYNNNIKKTMSIPSSLYQEDKPVAIEMDMTTKPMEQPLQLPVQQPLTTPPAQPTQPVIQTTQHVQPDATTAYGPPLPTASPLPAAAPYGHYPGGYPPHMPLHHAGAGPYHPTPPLLHPHLASYPPHFPHLVPTAPISPHPATMTHEDEEFSDFSTAPVTTTATVPSSVVINDEFEDIGCFQAAPSVVITPSMFPPSRVTGGTIAAITPLDAFEEDEMMDFQTAQSTNNTAATTTTTTTTTILTPTGTIASNNSANKLSAFDDLVEQDLQDFQTQTMQQEDWDDYAEAPEKKKEVSTVPAPHPHPHLHYQQQYQYQNQYPHQQETQMQVAQQQVPLSISNDDALLKQNSPFEAFEKIAVSPVAPSVAHHQPVVVMVEDVEEDDEDFGEFATSKKEHQHNDTNHHHVVFDEHVVVMELANDDNNDNNSSNIQDDEFGDFAEHETTVEQQNNDDPFADIAITISSGNNNTLQQPSIIEDNIIDVPMPSSIARISVRNIEFEEDEDDGFGDFAAHDNDDFKESTKNDDVAANVPEQTFVAIDVEEQTTVISTTHVVAEDDDPFADIPMELPPVSMLPLEEITTDKGNDMMQPLNHLEDADEAAVEVEDDDFGGFEVHSSTITIEEQKPAEEEDPFADIPVDLPAVPSNHMLSLLDEPVVDEPILQATVPSIIQHHQDDEDPFKSNTNDEEEDDDFGDFEAHTPPPTTNTATAVISTVPQVEENLLEFSLLESSEAKPIITSSSNNQIVDLLDMDLLSLDYSTPAAPPAASPQYNNEIIAPSLTSNDDLFAVQHRVTMTNNVPVVTDNTATSQPQTAMEDDPFGAQDDDDDFFEAEFQTATPTSFSTTPTTTTNANSTIVSKPSTPVPPILLPPPSQSTTTSTAATAPTPSSNVNSTVNTPTNAAISFLTSAFGLSAKPAAVTTTIIANTNNTASLVTFSKTANQSFTAQELEVIGQQLLIQYHYESAYECFIQAQLLYQLQELSEMKKNALEVDDLELAMKVKHDAQILQKQLTSSEEEYQWYTISTRLPLVYETKIEEMYETIVNIDSTYAKVIYEPLIVPMMSYTIASFTVNDTETMMHQLEHYLQAKQSMSLILQLLTSHVTLSNSWQTFLTSVTPMLLQAKEKLTAYSNLPASVQLEIKNHYVLQHYVCNLIGMIEGSILVIVSCLEAYCHVSQAKVLWTLCTSLLQQISQQWGLDSVFLNKTVEEFTIQAALLAKPIDNLQQQQKQKQQQSSSTIEYCTFSLRPLFQITATKEIVKKYYTQYMAIDHRYYATPLVNIWKHDIAQELPSVA